MELVRGFRHLKTPAAGSAVTIGNFDGLHRGHRELLARVLSDAAASGTTATVVLFEPHPREYFTPTKAPGRVLELRGKLQLLAQCGVQRVLCLPFGQRLATMSATDFVDRVLVEGLRTRSLVVGDDFRFGAGRAGDVALLRRAGQAAGFTVDDVPCVTIAGERVSSTRVRAALAVPDLALAEQLLGRPFAIYGRVRHGLELGRKLGMPTANVPLLHPPALRHGVYAVRVRHGDQETPGVASLGVRPTLNMTECVLEDFLFESPGNLYGTQIETHFVAFLRPQQKFDSLEVLGQQMQADAARAREVLKA
ncbi:MAG TPA: bifunctional riboflavin kinase/FAD synthetase [Nevskiaceae bacterium]|nr:bifunctional riboflavin kinase/FAD synthetase [Nevskiaceae bacterium]